MNPSQPCLEHEIRIANMFDRIAERYDLLNSLLSCRQDQRWRKMLISWLPSAPQQSLLDIACGTGDVLEAVVHRRQNFSHSTGIDISEKMLEKAEQKLRPSFQAKKHSLILKKMSAERLDFPEQTFDAITLSFGLRNVHDKKQALQECHRVLKAEASLFVLEFFTAPSGWMSSLFQWYFRKVLPKLGGLLSDKQAYQYLPKSVEGFYTLPQFLELAESAQFLCTRKKVYLWGSCALVELVKLPNVK